MIDFKKHSFSIAALLVACVVFTQAACDSGTSPEEREYTEPLGLSGVEYHPYEFEDPETAPDTSDGFNSISPGDLIILSGQNLNSVQRLYFNGVEASFNANLSTNRTLIASVPSIMFGELDADDESFGTIRVTNQRSEGVLRFPVLPGEPVLTGISNEYAYPGDEVTVYGSALYLAQSVTLPGGTPIPDVEDISNEEGTEATFTIPEGANLEPGPIVYETVSGEDPSTPAFQLLDNQNILFNADDYASWGGGALLSSSAEADSLLQATDLEEGARGAFAVLQADGTIPGGGNNEWYNASRSIQLNNQQWVAPENLSEAPGNFALKFELKLRQDWEAGSILIWLGETASDSYETGYAYRYQGWMNPESNPVEPALAEQGWHTVTIPFSDFRTMYGASEGSTPSSLTDLLGSDGTVGRGGPDNNATAFRLVNYSDRTIPAEQAFAVDNIRVSRIAGGEEEE